MTFLHSRGILVESDIDVNVSHPSVGHPQVISRSSANHEFMAAAHVVNNQYQWMGTPHPPILILT